MKSTKILFAAAALVLVAATLIGCSPAGSFVPEDTTAPWVAQPPSVDNTDPITSFVVRTDNYYFDSGEYYYFFSTFLRQIIAGLTEEQIKQFGLDIDTSKGESLKQIMRPDGISWYDYFRDMSLSHMTEILLVCEVAIAEDRYCINQAQTYYEQYTKASLGMPVADFVATYYGGNVTVGEFANAIQKEYIYNSYCAKKSAELKLSLEDSAVESFAASAEFGERDTSLLRNVITLTVERGSAEVNEAAANEILSAFLKGDKTAEAFRALGESERLEAAETENVSKKAGTELSAWLYTEGRTVGDCGVVKLAENDPRRQIVLYLEDGKAVYFIEAREKLTQKRLAAWIEGLKSSYTVKSDAEKLNDLNA